MFDKYIDSIIIAFDAIKTNKLRSLLTTLGIICGVAAVISMMAIGNGAKKEILEQLDQVGVNNIIIQPIMNKDVSSNQSQGNKKNTDNKFSPGLTLNDIDAIKQILPTIEKSCPAIICQTNVIADGRRLQSKLMGTNSEYFYLFGMKLQEGSYFSHEQEKKGLAVCIISAKFRNQLFGSQNPINKHIKCGTIWFKVVGVLEPRNTLGNRIDELGISLMDDKVFIPAKTMLLRVINRSLVNTSPHVKNNQTPNNNNTNNNNQDKIFENLNYNQLDQVVVQIQNSDQLKSSANVLNRILLRRHMGIRDFEIIIPELLLKQQQKTNRIFNIVLGAIASISLVVGGIGIMNIMFASILERIQEIGIRLAVGAKKKDIVAQFLAEAILISLSGGVLGIAIGILTSKLISYITQIPTIITLFSVFISFGVSIAIGIIFGYTPAKKASEKNPIESLRHE